MAYPPSQPQYSQGYTKGVLSTLYYSCFINDIPDCVSLGSTIRLFADESVLYRPIITMEDDIKLQEDLDKLQEWEKDWLMEFHSKKWQVLHVTSKRNPVRKDYTIHGETFEETESVKYLGVKNSK